MMTAARRRLAGFAVMLILCPAIALAQPAAGLSAAGQARLVGQRGVEGSGGIQVPGGVFAWQASAQPSPQPEKTGLSRGARIGIGVGVGAGAGLIFGEYVFGQGMDMPHGPDMLLGAGIGAGIGGLIAWAVTKPDSGGSRPSTTTTVMPVLSSSRKAIVMRLDLR